MSEGENPEPIDLNFEPPLDEEDTRPVPGNESTRVTLSDGRKVDVGTPAEIVKDMEEGVKKLKQENWDRLAEENKPRSK